METQATRLQNFPISFFAIILGMSGLTIALQRAEALLNLPINISGIFLGLTVSFFIIIIIGFLLKLIKYPKVVQQEYYHPIKINFFPASSISLLLLSVAFLKYSHDLSKVLWVIGAIAHLIFTLSILSIWIRHSKFKVQHKNAAWFIPVVGNIIAPVAGAELFPKEISWFFFSIGFILWLVLFTIFIYRAFFHEPIAEKLLPTFFILIAPPAVGFIAYYKLVGTLDPMGYMLYFFALFLTLLLFFNIRMFLRIKFYLSWWAYSFPISAIAIATTLMYHLSGYIFYKVLAYILISLLLLLVSFLIFRTIKGIVSKAICIED